MRSPVSVIIPCYRSTDTIDRAVGSVIRQTFPPEEILLVEDCSNDGGAMLAALHRLQELHRDSVSIRVVPLEKNTGPGGARNAGWELAQQPYIAFLDSDDSWHSRKLELQLRWMEEHPDVMMTGHGTMQLSPGAPLPEVSNQPVARPVSGCAMLASNRFPTRSVMLRRELSCRFDPTKRYAEDYLLWLMIVLGGRPAWFIDAPLAFSYKEDFGGTGLTGNLWHMEKGEIDTFRRVRREGLISRPACLAFVLFSLLKFARRLALGLIPHDRPQ